MGSYGDAALLAVSLVSSGKTESAADAWATATKATFPRSASLQKKACPKGAFLGLCEEGLVVDIPSGVYTRSEKNKRYAVDACRILRENPAMAATPDLLWTLVLNGSWMVHNRQMDVVLALWNAGLIAE